MSCLQESDVDQMMGHLAAAAVDLLLLLWRLMAF